MTTSTKYIRSTRGAPTLITSRLILRQWRDADLATFHALNSDRRVMEYFPGMLDRRGSDELASRIRTRLESEQFGLWAVEIPDVAAFAGFIGLSVPSFDAHFTPCVEVGWRLANAHWGKGYASEGAGRVLEYAFNTIGLNEIVSFTSQLNERSIAVMRRIGMQYDRCGDFEHPRIAHGHRLRRHVLYRIQNPNGARTQVEPQKSVVRRSG
jgi:RimJ/RimL family protein N-acetyltransferase